MLFIDCPIRPENLQNIKWDHIQLSDSELYLPRTKTKNGGSTIKLQIVLDRMKNLPKYDECFVFPKCIRMHLSKVLAGAKKHFSWPESLTFSVHCLRHTGHSARKNQVSDLIGAFVSDTTVSTFRHYTRSNAARLN